MFDKQGRARSDLNNSLLTRGNSFIPIFSWEIVLEYLCWNEDMISNVPPTWKILVIRVQDMSQRQILGMNNWPIFQYMFWGWFVTLIWQLIHCSQYLILSFLLQMMSLVEWKSIYLFNLLQIKMDIYIFNIHCIWTDL